MLTAPLVRIIHRPDRGWIATGPTMDPTGVPITHPPTTGALAKLCEGVPDAASLPAIADAVIKGLPPALRIAAEILVESSDFLFTVQFPLIATVGRGSTGPCHWWVCPYESVTGRNVSDSTLAKDSPTLDKLRERWLAVHGKPEETAESAVIDGELLRLFGPYMVNNRIAELWVEFRTPARKLGRVFRLAATIKPTITVQWHT